MLFIVHCMKYVVSGSMGLESLDPLPCCVQIISESEENPWSLFEHDLLCSGICTLALSEIGTLLGKIEQSIDFCICPERSVSSITELRAVEQRIETIVGITGHRDPTKHEHIVFALCGAVKIGSE